MDFGEEVSFKAELMCKMGAHKLFAASDKEQLFDKKLYCTGRQSNTIFPKTQPRNS